MRAARRQSSPPCSMWRAILSSRMDQSQKPRMTLTLAGMTQAMIMKKRKSRQQAPPKSYSNRYIRPQMEKRHRKPMLLETHLCPRAAFRMSSSQASRFLLTHSAKRKIALQKIRQCQLKKSPFHPGCETMTPRQELSFLLLWTRTQRTLKTRNATRHRLRHQS